MGDIDIKTVVGGIIGILIAVGLGMGLYKVVTNVVGPGLFFDLKLQEILNLIFDSITGRIQI